MKIPNFHLSLNTLVTIAVFGVLLYIINFGYSVKPELIKMVRENFTKVVIQTNQSTKFLITGYSNGAPYSTATASGNPVVNKGFINIGNVNIFTVATDPDIIPLGSIIWIEGLGLGMVSDTGPKVIGMHIDVVFTSIKEAMEWGKQERMVTVLERSN
jgi:3D (Asp-Asp-Asp) domain-containing protein